jgi:catechol 2,3-dioxygenase-like lactoylglutathione lyase family enzyme
MADAVDVLGVSHVSIYVSDMDRSLRFYRDVFGFEVIFDDPIEGAGLSKMAGAETQGRAVGGRIGDLRVELLQLSHVPNKMRPPGLGLAVLSLHVPNADAAYRAVRALGYRCRSEPTDVIGTRMFFALDPDGQGIEMVEYPAGSAAWGGMYR